MLPQDGKRFQRKFIGYDRTAVDLEFSRLVERTEQLDEQRQELEARVEALNGERATMGREQLQLNSQITSMTGQVVELETNLSQAKAENETLAHAIEAHKAEKNAMQVRFEQLRERDRDYALREREFTELSNSVSSIMSVTKRATDRLFQKVVENQERVTQIAGDAAREVAAIRADMTDVRQQLNRALDEVQDRIDRVDASLTGAVHKLVAIKHDDGLHTAESQPDILSEVERLLSMRAGEVDYSDGKGYSVPVLGPYSAKFVADTAKRVGEGKITAKIHSDGAVEVHRANATAFASTDDSIVEASKLLERGGMTSEEFYRANPQLTPDETSGNVGGNRPQPIGFTTGADDNEEVDGFTSGDDYSFDDGGYTTAIETDEPTGDDGSTMAYSDDGVGDYSYTTIGDQGYSGGYAGDYTSGRQSSGYRYYPVKNYSYQPAGNQVEDSYESMEQAVRPAVVDNSTFDGRVAADVVVRRRNRARAARPVSVRIVRGHR